MWKGCGARLQLSSVKCERSNRSANPYASKQDQRSRMSPDSSARLLVAVRPVQNSSSATPTILSNQFPKKPKGSLKNLNAFTKKECARISEYSPDFTVLELSNHQRGPEISSRTSSKLHRNSNAKGC